MRSKHGALEYIDDDRLFYSVRYGKIQFAALVLSKSAVLLGE